MIEKLRSQLKDKKTYPLKGQGSSQYPHRSRFITMIDRRKKEGKDDTYMYCAPGDCRDIPSNYVPEWFVSASKSTLLPDLEYGDGQNALKDANSDKAKTDETKEKLEKANIGSGFHAKGGLLTFSFQCKAADQIKCFLFYNGQVIRLFPDEIEDVFPQIFNMEHPRNKGYFTNNKHFKSTMANIEGKLIDKRFNAFKGSCE
mmetsp:Transcript_10409/g.9419  ORF Transcript_10409/g.9419 Transcript_10409/m.9419 type:complete len:201 (+) Transcript_10409:3-605(+)